MNNPPVSKEASCKIIRICKSLEKQHKIRILFAVENGSRAWRIESEDSDYDVRLVFVRHLEEYIKINKPTEVLEAWYDDKGKPCSPDQAFIDVVGFDVFKYVKMLAASNPTMIEWVLSDIVYYGTQDKAFKSFALKSFEPKALYYHYKSMCNSNYQKYLKSRNLVTYKKYLYSYRGLVNAKWVIHKKTVPPIIFSEALKGMKKIIPENIIDKITFMIKAKSSGKEKDRIDNIFEMDEYIEAFIKQDQEPDYNPKPNLKILDDELRKIVLKR